MNRKFLTPLLLLCCFMISMAAIGDLSGRWAGVLKAPDGNEYPLNYIIKIDGDKLTGTLDTPQGIVPLDKGRMDGPDFSFTVTVSGMHFPATGKYYAAGDSVAMDVNFEGVPTHTQLKRVP